MRRTAGSGGDTRAVTYCGIPIAVLPIGGGRLVITIEVDLVVKGVITNYVYIGDVGFGKVCLRNGGHRCVARSARRRARARARYQHTLPTMCDDSAIQP